MRLYYLDFLRLFLSFCIVHYHIFAQLHPNLPRPMFGSFLAVDCFFIISAFVLTQNIVLKNLSFHQFLVQRIARIFPLFWLSFVLIILAQNIDMLASNNLYEFVTQFFLVHALGFANGHLGWNYPSWTLSLEFWLNIGFLWFLVKTIEKKQHKEGIFMAIIFALFWLATFFIRFGNGNFDIHLQSIFSFTNIGVVRCLIGFLIGILVFYFSQSKFASGISKSKIYIFVCELTLLFLLIYALFCGNQSWSFLCIFFIFPLIILLSKARQEISFFAKICAKPVIKELGNFSYAIYLLHIPILYFLATFSWFNSKNPHLQTIILCAIVFFIAIPTYYFYEKKAKQLLIEKLS